MNNKIVDFLKTSLGIFMLTYFGLVLILTIVAFMNKMGNLGTIGSYMIKTGLAVSIICFVVFGRGTGRADGSAQSIYYSNNEYFKNIRVQEKPLRHVINPIIVASIVLAITGFLMIITIG